MLQAIDIVLPKTESTVWSWNHAVVYALSHEWTEKANFVVLINAAMKPGPNWLAGMLHDLDRRGMSVAGATSKVLYTSGKIKHAGYK